MSRHYRIPFKQSLRPEKTDTSDWRAPKEDLDGNGFYVNVPNVKFDVIFTAGHNLVEAKQRHSTNIKIVNAANEIPVSSKMIHVCQQYFDEPDEVNAIYDYGVILLKRDLKAARRGFGFNLMLGLAPPLQSDASSADENEKDVLHDRLLYVSGYRPNDLPSGGPPRKSDGSCIQTNPHQLVYKANTVKGMSGGPVWLGFQGVETVVAIQYVYTPQLCDYLFVRSI